MQKLQIAAALALVPVQLGSAFAHLGQNGRVIIDANSIDQSAWEPIHGRARNGVQVNSPRIVTVGQTDVLQMDDGQTISGSPEALEVFSVAYAQRRGHTVTGKPGRKTRKTTDK